MKLVCSLPDRRITWLRTSALALVMLLHLLAYRMLTIPLLRPAATAPGRLEFLQLSAVTTPALHPTVQDRSTTPTRGVTRHSEFLRRTQPPVPSSSVRQSADANDNSQIDWDSAMGESAQHAAQHNYDAQARSFGFPTHLPAPDPKAPEFGWDYARTHRVEAIPGGGLLINLSDGCVLMLSPLPIAMCRFGKKKANGDLFKHMQDATRAGETGLP